MLNNLPQNLFLEIVNTISEGRPLWGLLRLNEYLDSSHPLRKALLLKAQPSLCAKRYSTLQHEMQQIIAGTSFQDLTTAARNRIRSIEQRSARRTGFTPSFQDLARHRKLRKGATHQLFRPERPVCNPQAARPGLSKRQETVL